MCLHKRYIVNAYTGKGLYVNCGHCPACKQEKALARKNRIVFDASNDGSTLTCFVTLTYSNDFCPYIDRDELNELYTGNDGELYRDYIIYRNSSFRYFKGKSIKKDSLQFLDSISVPLGIEIPTIYLKGQSERHVGVLFYNDVQCFIKRLRFHYEFDFRYFCTSEYGPITCRPHFHLLFTIPSSTYDMFKSAVVASWPYGDSNRLGEYIVIARDASSYVSSYVNCDTSLALFFKNVDKIRPRSSFSKGYGLSLLDFSFSKVQEAFNRGSLTYTLSRTETGNNKYLSCLIPYYVIRRYFPKFKGFNRLNVNEIEHVVRRPFDIRFYAQKMCLDESDLHPIIVQLVNSYERVKQYVSLFDYSLIYARIWAVRASNILTKMYESVLSPKDNFELYDNISSLGVSVSNYTLEDLAPSCGIQTLDPNEFGHNRAKSYILENAYHSYSKDKKVRNFIYSKNHNL